MSIKPESILREFLKSSEGQPWQLGTHQFPFHWKFMFPRGFDQLPFPKEEKATCFRCPRIQDCGYRADYRCCTYHPRVPNFLLGLASTEPQGRAALEEAKQLRMLLPEGMLASPRQWLDFMEDQDQDLYGKSQRVLCPLLDPGNGHCRIHKFRNAVCSTYFCEHDLGEAAEEFWSHVQTLGSQTELLLSQWSMAALGLSLPDYRKVFDDLSPQLSAISQEQLWPESFLQKVWGSWYGSEIDFYQNCAKIVLEQKNQLWELASQRKLEEARAYETALDALAHEDPLEENEPIDPKMTWLLLQDLIN